MIIYSTTCHIMISLTICNHFVCNHLQNLQPLSTVFIICNQLLWYVSLLFWLVKNVSSIIDEIPIIDFFIQIKTNLSMLFNLQCFISINFDFPVYGEFINNFVSVIAKVFSPFTQFADHAKIRLILRCNFSSISTVLQKLLQSSVSYWNYYFCIHGTHFISFINKS